MTEPPTILRTRSITHSAPGIGVRAGKGHSGDVLPAELAVLGEERRLDVDAILASSEADELGSGLVAEATRAEMHADPDPAVLILEQVDVVVSVTDRSELVARHALELADLRNFMPERAIEKLVLDLLRVGAPDPERTFFAMSERIGPTLSAIAARFRSRR